MIRVAIIDDHVVVRAGLRYIIEADPELEFVGEYGGGRGAAEFVLSSNPDVVLLDVRMPDLGGIDALKEILAANPRAKVVMLTTSDVEEDVFRAIEEGALGYVMKESEISVISAAVRSAMAGEVYMTDEVRQIYETRKGSKGLSAREAQVLEVAAKGANNKEIAKEMNLSENSVKMFLKRAFFKLGASNRAEAVQLAVKRGLIGAGFTLVELLVVVVVMATLMTIMFRLAGVGGESAAVNKTVDRMHRLENALSGYYAAFGTYPPVKLHGSRNPFLKTNDYGDQSQNGDENGAIWGWCRNDGSGVAAGKGREEEEAWTQVRAACLAQPVACEFPFPDNLMKEFIKALSDRMKKSAEEMGDGPAKEIFGRGFDDGVSENKGRFSQYDDVSDWAIVQLFRFGLMSYLLPRYQIMMNGHADFFDYAQWLGNNTEPRDPLTGRPIGGWKYMQRQYVQGTRSSDLAHIANIPSQAACARWMASFDRTLTCNYPITLFGVNVLENTDEYDNGSYGAAGLNSISVQDIHVPGGYEHGDTSAQYVLDKVTVRDGWGQDFYYYSPAPYQSYVLWSGGPNKRTFPPWISRDTLDSAANRCVGYWIKDDIVNLSH